MGTVGRSVIVDDDGTLTTGTIWVNAELQKIYDNVDAEVKSASNPTVTTKSIIDALIAGIPHHFGGDVNAFRYDNAYPAAATADVLAPNTGFFDVDSILLSGTYRLEAMLKAEGGATVSLGLFNLTDSAAVVIASSEITSVSATGAKVRSAAIVFPAAGVSKQYGVKIKTSDATKGAAAWQIKLIKTG